MPRLANLSTKSEYSGQLRSVFFRRIEGAVTILRNGKPFQKYHSDTAITNISLAFADPDGEYLGGKFTIRGTCEGFFEFSSPGDKKPYDPKLHFPAFVRGTTQ